MAGPGARIAVMALGVTATVLGCGSEQSLPPAAEPADSPPVTGSPPGRIVALGDEPEGIVADPGTGVVAVALRDPDRLVLVDHESGEVRRRVKLSESPRHLSLAPKSRVLVPAERADELIEVRLPGGATRTTTVGEFPHDASASRGRVFVGNEFGDSISVVEGDRVVETLDAPIQPGGVASTARGQVVVVAVRERVLRSYDARTLEPGATVDGGVGPTHVVSDCGRRVYVADTQGDAALAYELDPELRAVDSLELPSGPYGIAADCRRRVLWVTLPGENKLVGVRLPARAGPLRQIASYPTVRQPNTVAVDSRTGRVFVAGRARGVLQVLTPREAER